MYLIEKYLMKIKYLKDKRNDERSERINNFECCIRNNQCKDCQFAKPYLCYAAFCDVKNRKIYPDSNINNCSYFKEKKK